MAGRWPRGGNAARLGCLAKRYRNRSTLQKSLTKTHCTPRMGLALQSIGIFTLSDLSPMNQVIWPAVATDLHTARTLWVSDGVMKGTAALVLCVEPKRKGIQL